MRFCGVGDDHRKRGFSGSWRSPEEYGREKAICLDSTPKKAVFSDNLFLTLEFIQCARPHTCGERSFAGYAILHSMVK